VDEMIKMLK